MEITLSSALEETREGFSSREAAGIGNDDDDDADFVPLEDSDECS